MAGAMRKADGLGSDLLQLLLAGALFAGAAAVVLSLRLPWPFLWIWLTALPLALVAGLRAKTDFGRRLSLVAFGLALSLSLFEGVFVALGMLKPGAVEVNTTTGGSYFVERGELGYAPRPGARVTSSKTQRKQLIYHVIYTISDRGVRVTKGNPKGDTWLFMGCSVMFGSGVNDDETLPSYFSADLDYQANVVNLGFQGYGPHQMLRSLEMDLPRPLIHGVVRHVIYEGIWTHPWRAAGHADWDLYGPSYQLSGQGVTYVGPFHGQLVGFILKVLMKSSFLQFVLDHTIYRVTLTDEDIERYARILERSAQLSSMKYGASFLMVYWDEDNEFSRRILQRLRKTTLPIVLVSEVIPRTEWPSLTLPRDGHPKPEANRRLAAALAARFGG
jgi:hypothetical protein